MAQQEHPQVIPVFVRNNPKFNPRTTTLASFKAVFHHPLSRANAFKPALIALCLRDAHLFNKANLSSFGIKIPAVAHHLRIFIHGPQTSYMGRNNPRSLSSSARPNLPTNKTFSKPTTNYKTNKPSKTVL
jgi:hypothetical protein